MNWLEVSTVMTGERTPPGVALVVDDDPVYRAAIARGLERRGLKTLEAVSGKPVMGLIERSPLSLLVLDILMEGQDGIETLRQVRCAHPELPVIMVSSDRELLELARTMGAQATFSKPFYLGELVDAAVEYVTGGPGASSD